MGTCGKSSGVMGGRGLWGMRCEGCCRVVVFCFGVYVFAWRCGIGYMCGLWWCGVIVLSGVWVCDVSFWVCVVVWSWEV